MQKGRNMQYVMAGVQLAPGIRMNVRGNVRLPDSEAGHDDQRGRQPYYAAQVRSGRRSGSVTVPATAALIFLCGLILLFGFLILDKTVQKAELSKKISSMESGIRETEADNMKLARDLTSARDSARISYEASQKLGMISSSGVEAVPVMAPDTRPFDTAKTAQAENSLLSAGGGMISGSR